MRHLDTRESTVRELMMALVDDLEALFKGRYFKTPNRTMEEIRAYPQFLPPRDAQTTEDPFPYIEVRARFGGINSPTDPQDVNVLLIVGIYDDGIGDFRDPPPRLEDLPPLEEGEEPDPNRGWDHRNFGIFSLLEILEGIQAHYEKKPNLHGFYRDGPVRWEVQEEESYPYFIGACVINFTLPAARVERSKYT